MAGHVFLPDNLPNGMIGLDTPTGQQMLERTNIINDLMVKRFKNQVNRTFCGPASLALIINALNVGYRIKYQQIQAEGNEEATAAFLNVAESGQSIIVTEDDVVNMPDVKEYLDEHTKIATHGLTMSQLENIAGMLGLGVNAHYACGNNVCEGDVKTKLDATIRDQRYVFNSVSEFRTFASDYIKRPVTGLIVNYNMKVLGYERLNGHFSPLAAYDGETDRFLVMDVWPDTPPAWVTAENLFNAMSTVDGDSNLPRGLMHIHELL